MQIFVGNYGRHIEADVYDTDGVTQVLPLSATVTVLNMDSGTTVLSTTAASVETGSAYYNIPSGSAITSTSAHMVAYLNVLVSSGNLRTYPVYFDVLDQASYLAIREWRRAVEEAAPSDELTEDDDARHWIDAAVAYVNKHYRDTGYTSVLGALSPAPNAPTRSFFVGVASLLARTSWYAGKGKYRDEELSFDPGPFKDEWDRLDTLMAKDADKSLMAVYESFNRDRVQGDGYKEDSPLYWYQPSGSTAPVTTIGI